MEHIGVIQEYQSRFKPYRLATIVSTSIAIPLNLFTAYLILTKSPPYFGKYKYVLLNIALCVFLTDIAVGVFFQPLALTEIFGAYATGLASYFGPLGGFASLVATTFLVGEYFVALLFAFLYRYFTLKDAASLMAKKTRRQMFYCVGALALVVIPPSTMTAATIMSFVPADTFKELALKIRPDFLPFFNRYPVFGVSFTHMEMYFTSAIIVFWVVLWVISVICALVGILKQLKSHRPSMSNYTYRMQTQLIKTLTVQTVIPMILFAAPITISLIALIFRLDIMNDMVELTEAALCFHSIANSLAVITLIVPYKKAVTRMFKRQSPWQVSASVVSISH